MHKRVVCSILLLFYVCCIIYNCLHKSKVKKGEILCCVFEKKKDAKKNSKKKDSMVKGTCWLEKWNYVIRKSCKKCQIFQLGFNVLLLLW